MHVSGMQRALKEVHVASWCGICSSGHVLQHVSRSGVKLRRGSSATGQPATGYHSLVHAHFADCDSCFVLLVHVRPAVRREGL